MLTQTILLAVLADPVLGLPQSGTQGCDYKVKYKVTSQEKYDKDPLKASGIECTSSQDNECELARQYQYAVGVTQTVSGSLGGGLDLKKIFGVAVDAGYSYSWSRESATATSATVQCPAGHYVCGLQAIETVVLTKGQRCMTPRPDGIWCTDTETICEDYKVEAPALLTNTPKNTPKNQEMEINFAACISECGGNYGPCDAPQLGGIMACSP